MTSALLLLIVAGCLALGADEVPNFPLADADSMDSVSWETDVYPILNRRCAECHGARAVNSSFRITSPSTLHQQTLVRPEQPDESPLLRRVLLPSEHAEHMPPAGQSLTMREVAVLRRWILQGAVVPENFQPPGHWAYVAPVRPQIPAIAGADSTTALSPIDAFVRSRLQARGLQPAPKAAPSARIRRLYFDLIGLPPDPVIVKAFLQDSSDEHYQRIVEDLLQRPQFGERWARHWLDLARYADSHGFQRDDLRDIWAYRDWVIRAMNDDMPFDQFTREQLAGDLMPESTESERIATGFHRCAPTNCEAGSLPEETRAEQLIDRVNTTATVWLGSTLECAQCHDHKYDPFTTQEYYQLLAFFNNTAVEADRTDPQQPSSISFRGPSMPLTNAVRAAQRADAETRYQMFEADVSKARDSLKHSLREWLEYQNSPIGAAGPAGSSETVVLKISSIQSEGPADTWMMLDDGSVLVSATNPPAADSYTVTVRQALHDVRAIRLETLTDDTLPGTGPGRGDVDRPNFVLQEFRAVVQPPEMPERKLIFTRAMADFSQKNWDASAAIDGNLKTGWAIAPQFRKSHSAVFITQTGLTTTADTTLKFQLEQRFGNGRTIGRFRLSAICGAVPDAEPTRSLPPNIASIIARPLNTWSASDQATVEDFRMQQDPESAALVARLKAADQQRDSLAPETTLVMVEEQPPRPAFVFERGDYRNRGAVVVPGFPQVLHAGVRSPENRLDLADWLISRQNPLVARVTVNRWWTELFGQGLVTTPEDFGLNGEFPEHPELLDWLAVELMEQGWSMKHLLRTIVLSATYQQDAAVTELQRKQDPRNRLLARANTFRLDAEMIRDNQLAVSGLLNLKQFGPPVRPPQPEGFWSKVGGVQYDYEVSPGEEQYRRGIYVVLKRSALYPGLAAFDAASRLTCTVRRSRTNTPLQALALFNDPVSVQASQSLAQRILSEPSAVSDTERLQYGFLLSTSRMAAEEELRVLESLLADQYAAFQNRQPDAERIVGTVSGRVLSESRSADDEDVARAAAWCIVSAVLLNLHETITRP